MPVSYTHLDVYKRQGVNAFDDANYTEAIDKLSKAKNINDSDYTVLNYLAHAYLSLIHI